MNLGFSLVFLRKYNHSTHIVTQRCPLPLYHSLNKNFRPLRDIWMKTIERNGNIAEFKDENINLTRNFCGITLIHWITQLYACLVELKFVTAVSQA